MAKTISPLIVDCVFFPENQILIIMMMTMMMVMMMTMMKMMMVIMIMMMMMMMLMMMIVSEDGRVPGACGQFALKASQVQSFSQTDPSCARIAILCVGGTHQKKVIFSQNSYLLCCVNLAEQKQKARLKYFSMCEK